MSKWNQEDRVYCMLKDMRRVGKQMTENTALLAAHMYDMEHILECIEIYNELSQRLLRMTDGMMKLAELSEGYRSIRQEPFLLGHFFISMTREIWPEAERKKLCFSVLNGGVMHEHVVGDLQMLMKACSEIIRNAVKYTREGGNIMVQLTELPLEKYAHYQMQVRDNGQGMAPEEISRALFLYPEGGFGLPVAEGILGKMGGGLHIESSPGAGTTVTADFFLELQERAGSGEGELSGRKVLIYEERQEEKEEVRRLLTQMGADCTAVCGEEELKACFDRREEVSYDVVCVGGRAVSEDLRGFLEYIRQMAGNCVEIIVIASYNSNESFAEAVWAGADGYIQRPLFCTGVQALFQAMISQI